MMDVDAFGVVVGWLSFAFLCYLWQYADLLSDGNIGADDEHIA
jgi:hypothetical protein